MQLSENEKKLLFIYRTLSPAKKNLIMDKIQKAGVEDNKQEDKTLKRLEVFAC